ncbi:MAG TPA: YwiC-like family protein [Candidatus Limnocylindrales bacterium]
MTPTARTGRVSGRARGLWFPHQHGAWAMLAVPLLLGVAASRPDPWQLLLAVAAVTGYLASATAQAWLRSRRRPTYLPSLVVYGSVFVGLGLALALTHPAVLATGMLVVPAAAVAIGGSKPGTKRDLVNSLAQVAIAIALVPAAALLAGPLDAGRIAPAAAVAAVDLVGVVLVVRSVIRERENRSFALVAVGWHAVATALAALIMSPAYVLVGLALTARAAALPMVFRRRAASAHPLRPVQVGIVEIVAAGMVVVAAFASPPAIR